VTATAETPGLRGQLGRFVAVGLVSAVVDFGVYHLLLALGTWAPAARIPRSSRRVRRSSGERPP